MRLDIDGAGRSSTFACLPTVTGTVAPARDQVPGEDLLGTSTAPLLSWSGGWLVFPGNLGGVWGVQGMPWSEFSSTPKNSPSGRLNLMDQALGRRPHIFSLLSPRVDPGSKFAGPSRALKALMMFPREQRQEDDPLLWKWELRA